MKQAIRADWQSAVLICAKCSKRIDGGFGQGGGERLAKALRRFVGGKAKGRKARAGIVEIGCQKICPKGAVVVIDGRRPGEWLLVRKGSAVDAVAERLGLPAA